jgi:hypothetical protein
VQVLQPAQPAGRVSPATDRNLAQAELPHAERAAQQQKSLHAERHSAQQSCAGGAGVTALQHCGCETRGRVSFSGVLAQLCCVLQVSPATRRFSPQHCDDAESQIHDNDEEPTPPKMTATSAKRWSCHYLL